MPCWPDIWDRVREELPIIEIYGSLIAYIAVSSLLLWAPRVQRRRLKLTLRVLGGLAAVPLLLILPALLFGLILSCGNPPAKTRVIRSPSGNEATLIYHEGFLGRDHTEVKLKQVGCCQHRSVFWQSGPSSLDDLHLEWLDSKHLRISFHARVDDPSHCEQNSGDVVISCTKLTWPMTTDTSAADSTQ